MEQSAENLLAGSSRNLYRFRREQGLTLDQLADKSGVGRSTLVKWEAGNGNPTLTTVSSVATALGLSIQELLLPENPGAEVTVVRAEEGHHVGDNENEPWFIDSAQVPKSVVEFYKFWVEPDPAGGHVSDGHGAGSVEHVYVASGRVTVGPLDYEVTLDAGDYASYPARGRHSWRSDSSEPSLVFITLTVPLSESQLQPSINRTNLTWRSR